MEGPRRRYVGVRRSPWVIFILISLAGTGALAQAVAPATTAPSLLLNNGMLLDIPANWVSAPDVALSQGFFQRGDARLIAAFHPIGSRPTVMPYALLEDFTAPKRPTPAEQTEIGDQVRGYYLTALRPPSKAERASSWKRSNVTPIAYDFPNQRFSFRAIIHFDDGSDDRVDVSGMINDGVARTLSVWSDDTVPARPEVATLLSSLRLSAGALPPPQPSLQESAIHFARVCGVLLILLIVGVQAYVFIRERRQRRDEELESAL